MRCPACYSGNIVSNRFETPDGREASHAVRAARELGHPVVAGLTAIAWIGAHVINSMRKTHRCEDCGHTFNDE